MFALFLVTPNSFIPGIHNIVDKKKDTNSKHVINNFLATLFTLAFSFLVAEFQSKSGGIHLNLNSLQLLRHCNKTG